MNKSTIIALVLLVLILGAAYWSTRAFPPIELTPPIDLTPNQNQGIACTMDAKMCPDGSYVGRSGPNCEFAACPDVGNSTSTQ